MYYAEKDTLDFYLSAPYFRKWDLSQVPVETISATRKASFNHSTVQPTTAAINFYALNHLSGLIQQRYHRHQKLPDWAQKVMEYYLKVLTEQHRRLFYYQTIICVREARHLHSMSTTWWNNVEKTFGLPFRQFQDKNKGDEGAALIEFDKNPPNMLFGRFVEAIGHVFYHGKFSSSYGGPAWGGVNDNLKRFVLGEITSEAMIDTAYTLAHNTGPIFNKGFYYECQNNHLLAVLDVQRAGLIPSLVLEGGHYATTCDPALKGFVELVTKNMPNHGIEPTVDWAKVQAAGAVGHYGGHHHAPKVAKPVPAPTMPDLKNSKYKGKVVYYPQDGEIAIFTRG